MGIIKGIIKAPIKIARFGVEPAAIVGTTMRDRSDVALDLVVG